MAEKTSSPKKEFKLTSLSVDNATSVIILTFLIIIIGISSYVSMPKENFPEIVMPTIYVGTVYPGNSPMDMENLITRPIEKEIKSIKGLKKVTSTSIQDYSTIIAEFNPDVEVAKALQDVKDAVDKSELPNDLDDDPNVFEVNFSEFPIMYVNISGNYSEEQLKAYGEYLQDEIEKLGEISEAPLRGVREREIKINADIYKMEQREVSFSDIENAVSAENLTLSAGNILIDEQRRSIRIAGEFENMEDIENIIVKSENQNIVYLKDIIEDGRVIDGYKERESYARSMKLPVVTLNIVKRSGENLLDASDKIKAIIDDAVKNKFPKDLKIDITGDQSKDTRSQLDNLENSIISGVILVVLVLLFFLGIRNALFVGIAIPLSMLMSFMILNMFGVTLNLMVLFSLILALGMLVDNGIVVVENVYRLLEEGKPLTVAIKQGVGEIALPIIASTATTVMAFVPLAFWGGIIGDFMKFLPITLIITLSSSLFVGLVINPVVALLFMRSEKDRKNKKKKGWTIIAISSVVFGGILLVLAMSTAGGGYTFPNILLLIGGFILLNIYVLTPTADWFQHKALPVLENAYSKLLSYALKARKPYVFFSGTIVLLILSLMILGAKSPKTIFFPINEPVYINIFIEKPLGTDIESTNKLVQQVEDEVIAMMQPYDFVEAIIAQVGEGATDPAEGQSEGVTPHKGRITVYFKEFRYRTGYSTLKIMEDIREAVKKYPGAQITVDKNSDGPPVGKPINIEVSGEDFDKLIEITEGMRQFIVNANVPGIEELKTDLEIGKPELAIEINRDKLRRQGLSTYSVAMELRTALFGKEVSKYKDGEDEYPIQLRLADRYRYDPDVLMDKRVTFRDNMGKIKQVPISSVADAEPTSTYGSIKRKDLDRVISIYSNVKDGYNANEIVEQLKSMLADYEVPPGYTFKFTGEQEEQAKSMAFLGKAMAIAVFAIFLIIVSQFNSVSAPFIIVASVLFSTIGVFLGLVAFNMDFVIIMTGIGIISLAGVVVNNAIVLIDYTKLLQNRRKEELGLEKNQRLPYADMIQCIIDSGRTRLRPVLLTAITTVLGLIPLAIGLNIDFGGLLSSFEPNLYWGGDNAIFWGPMAWTVIFGLTFATFLTLIIVPVMYLIADKIKRALWRNR